MMGKKQFASQVLSRSGLATILRKSTGYHGFVVLNYHRIGDVEKASGDAGVYSGTVEMFERQLRLLKRDCDVITPDDVGDLSTRSRGNHVMITFDDGYRDNHDNALPVLKAVGLKAVFFIATGLMDHPHMSWWDEIAWMVRRSKAEGIGPSSTLPLSLPLTGGREDAIEALLAIYKKLPPNATGPFLDDIASATGTGRAPREIGAKEWMTWDMVRNMRKAGMFIGGHTVNHPVLSTLSRFEQEREIVGCASAIEQQLGEPMSLFSYPRGKLGAFNEDTRAALYEARVQYAFSYYGGMNRPESLDPYDIRRAPVDANTPFEIFEAMVTCPQFFA